MAPKPPFTKRRPDHYFVHDVPAGHNSLTGRVIIAWSRLEAALEDLIWHFLDLCDDDGRLITARLDARPKVEMLSVLGERYLSPRKAANFKKLLIQIGDLQGDRNFIAHGLWGKLMPEDVPAALSLRPKAAPGEIITDTFPEERMEAIHADIERVLAVIVRVRDALSPSRNRLPKPSLR